MKNDDYIKMKETSVEIYHNKGYDKEEYCHEQSFLWGFEEGVDFISNDSQKLIEKACEWLNANWRKYIDTDADGMIRFSGWKNDFKKAMEDKI